MNAGNRPRRRTLLGLAGLALAGWACLARAIDNPDAPDRVAEFESRALPFEQALDATDGGGAATRAGQAYARFLGTELQAAYGFMLGRLQGRQRQALVESQLRWARFREAESRFISQQWDPARVGTSASLSVAGYQNAIVKERVLQLLRYAAEYR